jgi:SAM-dependent methyltransferase
MARPKSYLIEDLEDIVRLEVKTNPEAVRKQGEWCGLRPGFSILDAGCGPGKVTSILYEMIQPGGCVLGVDYAEERIEHATQQYSQKSGIGFRGLDLRDPLDAIGPFDLIWARFVLEYNRVESFDIVKNLSAVLKPGGALCLLDLDHNCLNHYELPPNMEQVLLRAMRLAEEEFNFDPYSGRKLYSYLYDLGYQDIQLDLRAHHLIYGEIGDNDLFNWVMKGEIANIKAGALFETYPGGRDAFFSDFRKFLMDPRRFIYTPLILCKGVKPFPI